MSFWNNQNWLSNVSRVGYIQVAKYKTRCRWEIIITIILHCDLFLSNCRYINIFVNKLDSSCIEKLPDCIVYS